MKTKIISLVLSIFLLFETMPVIAIAHQVRNSPAQLVETAHKAYNRNDFLKAGQYYEKAYSIEKNQVFIDNAITAYSSYAFNLANEKKYDEAIKYCQKVLSLKIQKSFFLIFIIQEVRIIFIMETREKQKKTLKIH